MRKKINIRLFGIAVFSIVVTIAITTSVFYSKLKVQVFSDLSAIADVVEEQKSFSIKQDNLRITVVNTDGTVNYDSNYNPTELENHTDRPEIASAKKNGIGKAIRRSDTLSERVFYYAKKMEDGRILRVGKEAHGVLAIVAPAIPIIILLSLILLGICLIVSAYLTMSLVKPVEDLSQDMDNIGEEIYPELKPFIDKIRTQHQEIMSISDLRQEFTANVTHELKTPLTAISGYAEIMENGMAGDEEIKHFSSEIRKSAGRLLLLINDIIKLSQLDTGLKEDFMEEVDLSEIARDSVSMLAIRGDKENISLSYEGMDGVKVKLGKEFAQELVYNLIENGIRYNVPFGKVLVKVVKEDDKAILLVKDTGIGIPKDQQSRVFERFYRVDKSRSKERGGTGLGLAIVKHICVHTGGKISLDSEVGKGTEIKISWELN